MTIQIRQANPEDCLTIAQGNIHIARETEGIDLDPPTVREGVRLALDDPQKALYFIAEIAGECAGMLMITHEWSDWRSGDIWWIQSVYVWSGFRRRGVFRALFEHVQRAARDAGAVGLRLYVDARNSAAIQTYASLGMDSSHYKVMERMWDNGAHDPA